MTRKGRKTDRYTAGGVYYFSNTLLFEADYEWLRSHGPAALPSQLICPAALLRILNERT